MKILLVDDSVATLDSFSLLFDNYGHRTFTAHNVTGALTSLEQRSEINLVICDYYMPAENGFSLCAKIRAMGKQVPIIMLTAAGRDEVEKLRERCNMLGNIMVMRKPVDPDVIVQLLSDLQDGKPDSVIVKG